MFLTAIAGNANTRPPLAFFNNLPSLSMKVCRGCAEAGRNKASELDIQWFESLLQNTTGCTEASVSSSGHQSLKLYLLDLFCTVRDRLQELKACD